LTAEVPDIVSTRLVLASLSPEVIECLLSGDRASSRLGFIPHDAWPEEQDEHFLKLRLSQMREDPSAQQWLVRVMLSRDPARTMIGHIGFHGPPVEGAAELGYTVFPEYRRRGYAREAARALMDWAHREHAVDRFIVSISPENAPSLALAADMRFKRTGEQMDEIDGLEYVFELRY
jgi:RimJ/RimL family protein N-acetyltransferase